MRHCAIPLLLAVSACSPRTSVREPAGSSSTRTQAAAALLAALADTTSAYRVFLPTEVAKPAESIEGPDYSIGAPAPAVQATILDAAIRGVVDTLGFAERATLTVLPGSDPREGSLLVRRAERARWRPARLASGQAVRQLFEWRECRTNTGTCTNVQWEQVPAERTVPHVGTR